MSPVETLLYPRCQLTSFAEFSAGESPFKRRNKRNRPSNTRLDPGLEEQVLRTLGESYPEQIPRY